MQFESAQIKDAWVIDTNAHADPRGHFARAFCAREFVAQGLPASFVQSSLSFNRQRGTIRGLHFQWPPSAEGKLVRCVRGRVFDVMVDIRPDSVTFLRHVGLELSAERINAVYIPPGVAHGFQTLEDASEVLYEMTDFYVPSLSDGFPFDDPAFGVRWPVEVTTVSDRDRDAPQFDKARYEAEYRRRIMLPG